MSAESGDEIDKVLSEIEAHAKKRPPTRFQARAALVPLGEALLADDAATAARILEPMKRLIAAAEDPWRKAIAEELTLACTEHVRSCDPQYLGLPKYDFPYTVAARHRLEARLRAAAELDLPADEALLEQVARADDILEPYLRRAASQGD